MMTPTIRVDDEVFAVLQAEATPFVDTPNTVLRRRLGLSEDGAGSTANRVADTEPRGRLWQLMETGLLATDDELTWHRRQQGRTFTATVRSDGGLVLMGHAKAEHDSPSSAAREAAGYEVNGWKVWRHTKSGKTLDELWTEHEAANS